MLECVGEIRVAIRKNLLPEGTIRRDGLVLSTRARAADAATRDQRRAKMYELLERHPETAEEIAERVAQASVRAAAAGDPLNITKHSKPSKEQKPSAVPPSKLARVSSPTVRGAVEQVQRVVNSIDHLRARRQIGEREYLAALTYRDAYDIVHGTVGGAMDPDKVHGAGSPGSPGSPPPPAWLYASDKLLSAEQNLYRVDLRIVEMVVGQGRSLLETAALVYGVSEGGRPSRNDLDRTSDRLKVGLGELAAVWHPGEFKEVERKPARSVWRAPGAKPAGSDASSVPQGTAVHATGKRVFRSR